MSEFYKSSYGGAEIDEAIAYVNNTVRKTIPEHTRKIETLEKEKASNRAVDGLAKSVATNAEDILENKQDILENKQDIAKIFATLDNIPNIQNIIPSIQSFEELNNTPFIPEEIPPLSEGGTSTVNYSKIFTSFGIDSDIGAGEPVVGVLSVAGLSEVDICADLLLYSSSWIRSFYAHAITQPITDSDGEIVGVEFVSWGEWVPSREHDLSVFEAGIVSIQDELNQHSELLGSVTGDISNLQYMVEHIPDLDYRIETNESDILHQEESIKAITRLMQEVSNPIKVTNKNLEEYIQDMSPTIHKMNIRITKDKDYEGESPDLKDLRLITVVDPLPIPNSCPIASKTENGITLSNDGLLLTVDNPNTNLDDTNYASLTIFEGEMYLKGNITFHVDHIPPNTWIEMYTTDIHRMPDPNPPQIYFTKDGETMYVEGIITKVLLCTSAPKGTSMTFYPWLDIENEYTPDEFGYITADSSPTGGMMFVFRDADDNPVEGFTGSITYNKDINRYISETADTIKENEKLMLEDNRRIDVLEESLGATTPNLKKTVNGESISIDDVSPMEHTIKVQLSSESVTDLSNVKLMVSDDTDIIPYPYHLVWDNFSVIEQGHIQVSGTDSGENTYIALFSDLIETGGVYCLSGVNHPLITVEFTDAETGMIQQPILVLDDNMYYKVDNNTPINIELFASHTTDEGTVDIYPKLTKVDSYIPTKEGFVEITSHSPTMSFSTDTEGVNIEVEYNQDTNKVIKEIEDSLGDINTALDSIIAIQNELIGGDAV